MEITQETNQCSGIRISLRDGDKEVGRAFLYIMRNDSHTQPFGFMEDVYVTDKVRGQGLGTLLVQSIIKLARDSGCYKLIATSRHNRERVHRLYTNLGFHNHGTEFRIDF